MSDIYNSIMTGLDEALADAQGKGEKLKRHTITIEPVKQYNANEVKAIRRKTGMTQRLFAGYLGVSVRSVEAWEAGINIPSGAASRILSMMEMDEELTQRFPFVAVS